MKNKKIAIRILLILISILCILLPTKVSAMSQEEAGECIAKYAINFARQNGSRTEYYNYDAAKRYYSVMTGQPNPNTNTYVLECSSFASMVLKQSIGLKSPDGAVENNNGSSMFWDSLDGSYPTSEHYYPELFDIVQGDLKQGDILVNDHHVMVYVGNNSIVHCDGRGAGIGQGGISFESIDSYNATGHSDGCSYYAFRLKATVAEGLSEGNIGGGDFEWPDIGAAVDAIKAWWNEDLLEKQEDIPIGTPLSDEEYNKLYYKGIATLKGTTTEEEDTDDWIFPSLADITDWIGGFIIMPFRAAVTGWANVVQIAVSQYINYAAGEETADGITSIMADMSKYMDKSITLEKIVYNEIPLFDVNVFSGNEAGGETVKDDTLVSAIRTLVANWYYVFRLVAIIGLLLILIYIGIKMAISTAAEEKAKYKTLFVNWLIAFVIVFFMQYFMVFVMQINQALIDIFKEIGKSLNLYETVRTLTWETKMTTGIIATALYVMLIYYMLKFVVMYFKRLFIVVILIILAPLVAAKYAIDKLSGNKDTQSLKVWGQEYVFNVLMQSIHALTYTIFTAVSVDIAKATTNSTSDVSYLFANVVLVIIFFRFMIESEKILKHMMKLVTGPGADFGDANSTSIRDLFGLTIFSQIMRELKPFYKFGKFVGRKAIKNNYVTSKIKRPFRSMSNYIQDSYVLYNTELYKNRLRSINSINFDTENAYSNLNIVGLDDKLDKVLRQDLINRKELLKDYIGTDFNVLLGMGKTFVGLPIFLAESPLVGAELMLVGLRTVRVAIGKPVTGYRKPQQMSSKWYKSPVARGTYKTMATILSAGTVNVAQGIYERYKGENELIDLKLSQAEMLLMARNVEYNMKNDLTFLKDQSFQGFNEGASTLQKSMAEINEKELLLNIRESQLSVPESEILNEVQEYKKQTGRYTLNNDDMNNIINNIRNRENQKLQSGEGGVKLTNKINNNMDAEFVSGIVNNVKGDNSGYSSLELSQESLEIMSNNLRGRIEELEGKENKTEQEIEETNTLKIAYYMIKQKQIQNIDENEINELGNMTNNMQTIIRSSEENSKEDEIRTVVYNVLNDRKQKLENDLNKFSEDFTKQPEPIMEPGESKNDLNQIRQKLEERLDELNKQENLDEQGVLEREATQRAYNIVQYDIEINESNKELKKDTKEIAQEIMKNNSEISEATTIKMNTQQDTINEETGTKNTQENSSNYTREQNVKEETGGIKNGENVKETVKDNISGVEVKETIQTKIQEKEEPISVREVAQEMTNNNETREEPRNVREIAQEMTNNNETREEPRNVREIAQEMMNNNDAREEPRNVREIAQEMINNNTQREEVRDAREIAQEMINNNTQREEVKNAREIAQEMINNNTQKEETNDRYSENKEFNNKVQDVKRNKIEDIINSIEKGEKSTVYGYELRKEDEQKVNKAIIDSMSESILKNEISKLSDKDLGRLIKKSTRLEGSIEKNKVSDKYKDIVKKAEKLRDMNEESEEKYGRKMFTTKELIDGIRRGIRGKDKNKNDEEV